MAAFPAQDDSRIEDEEEHLLSERYHDDLSASNELDGAASILPTKKGGRRLRPLLFILIAIPIVTILAIIAFRYSRNDAEEESAASSPHDEYILDPNWDFGASPQRREYDWTITDVEMNPDGVFRPMVVVNGQFPGPLIECNEGDTIVIRVQNDAVNATSIHWHGMYQNGTNWMDGTVGITQCPIAPGNSFTYEFSTAGQWGTYWWHGHRGVQASDGLLGPLIIHSDKEHELQQIQYDTDRVIMVQDHYYNTSSELMMDYLKPDNENAEPVPDSALINGHNVRDCASLPDRRCDSSLASLPVLALEEGKKHRLRFINVGAFAEFQVQIDEHEFAITEVDGTDVVPAYFHRLNILPAQRYSIIVDANMTQQNAFWLRARMVTHCFAEENEETEPEVRAIVQYADHPTIPVQRPDSRDWPEIVEVTCKDMNTTDLHPVEEIAAPAAADDIIFLRSNFEIGNWKLSRGFFNSSSWRSSSSSSSLSHFIAGIASGNESFTSTLSQPFGINDQSFDVAEHLTYQTTGIRTVDILTSNFDDGTHPMHLHGYKFWVLGSGAGYPPNDLFTSGSLDLSNPLRRDTASIDAYGWLLLRVVLDNAGLWALHCHITWHAEAGLMMQVLAQADVVSQWTLPFENENLCGVAGTEKGERPADEIWYGKPKEMTSRD